MNARSISRALLAALAAGSVSVVVACSSGPAPESVEHAEEPLGHVNCPIGWARNCTGPSCSCTPIDGYFSILDKAGAVDVNGPDTACWLDLGPFPFPPELEETGCTKTAVYHNRANDLVGGRIWFCPASPGVPLNVPASFTPAPPAGYQTLDVSEKLTISSPCLGTPKQGWAAIVETLQGDDDGGVNRGCSGMCR